jgi:serine phosphatase RsbU (regulator of sigma subunit)
VDREREKTMPTPPTLISREAPAPDESWLAETLERLLAHVRTLLPADGVAIAPAEQGPPLAEWSATPDAQRALSTARGAYEESLPEGAAVVLHDGGALVTACPVTTATGTVLGVLLVATLTPPASLGRAELRTLQAVADLAALALERAELLDQEAQRAREELALKRAAEEISSSLELDAVYARVLQHAISATGATKAAITRVNTRGAELAVVASVNFSNRFAHHRLSLQSGMLGSVARTRAPHVSQSGGEEWHPGGADDEGVRSFIHVPIELGPRLFGVLTVAHEEADRFDNHDLERALNLARSSAAALANAVDYERERRIARALTLGFVPEPLPELPGYESGLHYVPAFNEPVGGDVYGAWRMAGGQVAMLVGDVAGKGVETAALSAMVRFFIEARSWDSASPGAVLAETNAMLGGRMPRDSFVTAFLAMLEPGRLHYASAGHLPALLIRPDSAESLGATAVPLGIDAELDYEEVTVELNEGDLVFAYTDGLMEARRGGVTYGLDRLGDFVQRMGRVLGPEELVHRVHREVASWADSLGDDVVALALRRRR